jgi:hypothetical protein
LRFIAALWLGLWKRIRQWTRRLQLPRLPTALISGGLSFVITVLRSLWNAACGWLRALRLPDPSIVTESPAWKALFGPLPPLFRDCGRTAQETGPAGYDTDADYEPLHLQVTTPVFTDETSPDVLTPGRFRVLLEQIPTVRTIAFTGPPDPLQNPYLADLITVAYRFNGVESTVYTDGELLEPWIDRLLESPLTCLALGIIAHRPSHYARLTGRPLTDFIGARDTAARLIARKREWNAALTVDLCMTVDLHNFRDMPDMLAFAESLGADGVRFENYLSPDPEQRSDRTLYTHQASVMKFLRWMESTVLPVTRLYVTLPVPLDADMSGHRHCREPFTTVAVESDLSVSGCSRRVPWPGPRGKIWDPDFWNNDMYHWLRSIHSTRNHGIPLPPLCRACPNNMPSR